MEPNKLNYYAIITADVRYSKNICMGAKLLYGEISALSNEKGYCWATNKYFEDLYEVDKTTIIRWINQLIENGFVHKTFINNQRQLSIKGGSNFATPSSKIKTDKVAKIQPINNKKNNTRDKLINDKPINDKLTNYLIDINFLSVFEPNIKKYNKLFQDSREAIGEETLDNAISYIISKSNLDMITNKYSYIEKSLTTYIKSLNIEYGI